MYPSAGVPKRGVPKCGVMATASMTRQHPRGARCQATVPRRLGTPRKLADSPSRCAPRIEVRDGYVRIPPPGKTPGCVFIRTISALCPPAQAACSRVALAPQPIRPPVPPGHLTANEAFDQQAAGSTAARPGAKRSFELRRRGSQVNGQPMHQWTTWFARFGLAAFGVVVMGAAAAHAASDGGLELMPDFARTLPGLLIAFLLLAFPVNALLLKPILKTLDERIERIEGTRAKAERIANEGQAVLERYETALREARDESELERRARLDDARATMLQTTSTARNAAEVELERARAELASALDGARATLRGQADELAREAAASVLGRPV